VVGVQPFGGEGLSGTGPKAGGPLYLYRLLAKRPNGIPASLARSLSEETPADGGPAAALTAFRDWLLGERDVQLAARCDGYLSQVLAGATATLPGPTGERNTYALSARGTVLCIASTASGARVQLAAVLATGNRALFIGASGEQLVGALPVALRSYAAVSRDGDLGVEYDAVLFEGDSDALQSLVRQIAARGGPIVSVQSVVTGAFDEDACGDDYALERLLTERSVSVNTAAAGGNASLMTIG
jgi:RHH-type proline utilization regulon transcriptional repressor/proline dehydrogenase/delta 1-pyrroline-5-carboxylate dehydrogenase